MTFINININVIKYCCQEFFFLIIQEHYRYHIHSNAKTIYKLACIIHKSRKGKEINKVGIKI